MNYGKKHLRVKIKGIVGSPCNSSTMRFFFFYSCGSVVNLLFFALFHWFVFCFSLKLYFFALRFKGKRVDARSVRWVLSGHMMWNCKQSIKVYKLN